MELFRQENPGGERQVRFLVVSFFLFSSPAPPFIILYMFPRAAENGQISGELFILFLTLFTVSCTRSLRSVVENGNAEMDGN